MEKKQSKYSKYRLGKIDLETEKAFQAIIDNFCDKPIWIPRSVVDPEKAIQNIVMLSFSFFENISQNFISRKLIKFIRTINKISIVFCL